MPARLCQIVAAEKGVKARANSQFTQIHHLVQRAPLLTGLTRTYQPKDDEGEQLPPESTRVQLDAEEALKQAGTALTALFDVTATKEWGNTGAAADIVIDGAVLLRAVPVTYLLFLEKQLVDLHTFVEKLPVLDAAETWSRDNNAKAYRSSSAVTHRTRKVPRNHVKAPATDKHPAQVEVYHEDVTVGSWTTTKFSGALPAVRVAELLERVEKLSVAVKFAREEANSVVVEDRRIGEAVFGYLFA